MIRLFRIASFTLVLSAGIIAGTAAAQAPETGPLVLRVPVSTRATALGNAWTAGRDQDVIFYNPAQLIGTRPEFNLSISRPERTATMGSMTSVYAAGPMSMTFGWGVQWIGFSSQPNLLVPFSPTVLLLSSQSSSATSALLTAGGAIVLKGFRIGAAGKYVSENIVGVPHPESALPGSGGRHALLADIGVARSIVGGVGAIAFQNLGHDLTAGESPVKIPRQVSIGWSTTRQAGPLDLGIFGASTFHRGWASPGAGLEAGYSWIDGYAVTLRAGVKRPETATERPVAIGAGFSADRLTVDYAVQFFDNGRYGQRVTIRWR